MNLEQKETAVKRNPFFRALVGAIVLLPAAGVCLADQTVVTWRAESAPQVDGVAAFTHGSSCCLNQAGDGYANLQRVLWGYASHPNCGGVLMVGLGCETNQIDDLMKRYGLEDNPRFRAMNIQDQGGLRKTIDAGRARVGEMLPEVNRARRTPCPVSGLVLGLQLSLIHI